MRTGDKADRTFKLKVKEVGILPQEGGGRVGGVRITAEVLVCPGPGLGCQRRDGRGVVAVEIFEGNADSLPEGGTA